MEKMITEERQQKSQSQKKRTVTIVENIVLKEPQKETFEESTIKFVTFETNKIRAEQNRAKQNIEAKKEQLEKIKKSVKEATSNIAQVQNEAIERSAKLELKKHYINAIKTGLAKIRNNCEKDYKFCQTISEDLQNWSDCLDKLKKHREEYLEMLTAHLNKKESELEQLEEYSTKMEKIETIKKKQAEIKQAIEAEEKLFNEEKTNFDEEIHTLNEELQLKTHKRMKLSDEIEKMRNNVNVQNQTKNDFLEKVKVAEEAKIKLQISIQEKENFLNNLHTSGGQNVEFDESQINETVKQIEESVCANNEKNKTLTEEISQLKAQHSEISQKTDDTLKNREELVKQIEQLNVSFLQTQLEETKNDLKLKKDAHQKQLEEVDSQFQNVDEKFGPQITELEQKVEELKKELGPTKNNFEELKLKVEENANKRSELLASRKDKDAQKSSLTDKCAGLVNRIREMEKAKDSLMAAKRVQLMLEQKCNLPVKHSSLMRSELEFSDSSSELGFIGNKKKPKIPRL